MLWFTVGNFMKVYDILFRYVINGVLSLHYESKVYMRAKTLFRNNAKLKVTITGLIATRKYACSLVQKITS